MKKHEGLAKHFDQELPSPGAFSGTALPPPPKSMLPMPEPQLMHHLPQPSPAAPSVMPAYNPVHAAAPHTSISVEDASVASGLIKAHPTCSSLVSAPGLQQLAASLPTSIAPPFVTQPAAQPAAP